MKILLIEDDAMLGKAVKTGLARLGAVDWIQTAEDAEVALRAFDFDAVVADIGLPGESGLSLVRRLRAQGQRIPVLFLTARDTVRDRVAGLDSGGDDYLIKPFDLDELLARVRALTRRAQGQVSLVLTCGSITLDPAGRTVVQNGSPVPLSAREFAILELLLLNKNKMVSRTQIESKIYDMSSYAESNAVEVHISSLRRKLGKRVIQTIRNMGYTIDEAVAQTEPMSGGHG